MARDKRPSFQFYPADWLASKQIALMTPAQEGGYIHLIAYMWDDPDCSLPDDDGQLSLLSRLPSPEDLRVVKNAFNQHPTKEGYLTHDRLLEERKKQDDWREKSRLGGIKSAEIRANKGKRVRGKGGSKMVATNRQPMGNTSSSTSSSIKNKESGVEKNLDPWMPLVEIMISQVLEVYPKAKVPKNEKQKGKWADIFRLLEQRDGNSFKTIEEVLEWVGQDQRSGPGFPGWASVIRSPEKLRQKWDDIMIQMKSMGRTDDSNIISLKERLEEA